ncbi:hypothetical protein D0T11_01805 [Hymenobacter rubripertinctus]|uniref:Uncharacterized protein n=2 Tax=Hymenobacter rubripertinctus TaxID=2029981 RepID=A0A418R975_9BACT|nr:hypothetical protein D0T11_01805 [Hymenobacter rubripertinctus]
MVAYVLAGVYHGCTRFRNQSASKPDWFLLVAGWVGGFVFFVCILGFIFLLLHPMEVPELP